MNKIFRIIVNIAAVVIFVFESLLLISVVEMLVVSRHNNDILYGRPTTSWKSSEGTMTLDFNYDQRCKNVIRTGKIKSSIKEYNIYIYQSGEQSYVIDRDSIHNILFEGIFKYAEDHLQISDIKEYTGHENEFEFDSIVLYNNDGKRFMKHKFDLIDRILS